ncbi:unnamed protein product [Adineta ricciae]|uniref:G-protein coupled receptors family 1 profile domain-containing protein n=1 Tax=Adineta ricciae TaxID=249248 RepID=A0A815IG60_ADIRI|nr:unnamed protein product [Adineta ricciae]CAF1474387.1 unnamed protein product [Adineta ricciae]
MFDDTVVHTPTLHVILTIISLIATIIGTAISFMILTCTLLRKETFTNVRLMLCTNNYIAVFFVGIVEIVHLVIVTQSDFGITVINIETLGCRIRAYILFSCLSVVYLACVLQAMFCLFRIIYPSVLWVTEPRICLGIILLSWIVSFTLVSPLLILHGQRLIPGEYTCRVPKDDSFSIAYSTLIVYGIPFSTLAYIYFQIHRFLRIQAMSTLIVSVRTHRDRHRYVTVFRRIIVTVMLLGAFGMPNSVMLIILAIKGELISSFYRILDMSFAALVLTLSIALLYINPHLKRKVKSIQHQQHKSNNR